MLTSFERGLDPNLGNKVLVPLYVTTSQFHTKDRISYAAGINWRGKLLPS
jgi:hypothetical protein